MSDEPDYKALYFELAEAVCHLERTKRAVFDQQADGIRYWQAQARVDKLTGAALLWRCSPKLYGRLLAADKRDR
jgi:hypothetical protein